MKTCTKCNQTKEPSAFIACKRTADGLQSWCKKCKAEAGKAKGYYARWKGKNLERAKSIQAKYREANKEAIRIRQAAWQKANNKETLAKTRKYQAAKINATPAWLTVGQIKQMQDIYVNCPEGFEVDHIIPLQGATVRGLHVPWNLQYLEVSVNRRKSNKVA